MTMLKRLLALVMILSICITPVLPVNAEGQGSVYNETVFEKEMTLLAKLEITSHLAESQAGDSISRIDFLQMVMKMIQALPTRNSQQLFYDLDPNTEAGAYVRTAHDLKVITGIGAGLFGADSELTYDEAASMLLKAMNYKGIAEEKGGYPVGYRILASQLEIMNPANYESYLTFKDACVVVFRAMCADLYDSYMRAGSTDNILNSYFHISSVSGTVMQNRFTKIPAGSGFGDDKVLIQDAVYLAGETDIQDYLGHNLEVYFTHEDSASTPEVVYFEPTGNNRSMVVNATELTGLEPGSFAVETESAAAKEYKLSGTAVTIENHAVMKLTDSYSIPDSAVFEFIDNNGDGVYDVVKIEKHEIYAVSSANADTKTIYSADESTGKIELEKYDWYNIVDSENQEIGIEAIGQGDVLAIVRNSSYQCMEIAKCAKTAEEVINITYAQNGKTEVVSESGNRYTVSDHLAAMQPQRTITIGQKYVFALNPMGEITYIAEAVQNTDMRYGYLMKWAYVEKGIASSTVQMKMLTEDSSIVLYETGEKVTIGDNQKVTAGELAALFTKPQMIRYQVNEEGDVTRIQLALDEGNEGFRKVGTAGTGYDSRYYTTTNTVGGRFVVDANTKVFIVSSDVEAEHNFSVTTAGKALVKSVNYPNAIGYTCTANSLIAEAMIIYQENTVSIGPTEPIFVFEQYVTLYDAEKGETYKGIAGYYKGAYSEFALDEEIEELQYTVGTETRSVKKGDVLRLATDSRGKVLMYSVLFDAENQAVLQKDTPSSRGFSYQTRFDYGSLCKKYDKYFTICLNDSTEEYDGIYVPVAETYIYVYDPSESVGRQIQPITFEELEFYDKNAKVFIALYYSQPRGIVVYK